MYRTVVTAFISETETCVEQYTSRTPKYKENNYIQTNVFLFILFFLLYILSVAGADVLLHDNKYLSACGYLLLE